MAAIWREVLGVSRVGVAELFELGGHSLLATKVIARIRADFGVELPLRAMFDVPMIAPLVEAVHAARRAGAAAALAMRPLPREARRGRRGSTAAKRGLA